MQHRTIHIIFVVLAASLVRGAIVVLQPYSYARFGFIHVGAFVVFGLPLLEVVTLIASCLPLSPRTEKIVRAALFLVPVFMINAAWRTIEYFRTLAFCEVTSGGQLEAFCDTVGLQVFIHVPFMVLGVLALVYYRIRKTAP